MTCMLASTKASKFGFQVSFQSLWSSLSIYNWIAHSLCTAVKNLKPDPTSYFSLSSTLCGFGCSRKTINKCKIQANKVQNCQLHTSRLC